MPGMKINPKIKFYEAEGYLKTGSLNAYKIENSALYKLVENLTGRVRYSFKDKYDTRWEDFYLPLKRWGKEICVPFNIVKYKKDYYCNFFKIGMLEVKKGDKPVDKIYKDIFREAIRFTRLIKQTRGEVARKVLPYDFRTGKIKGKFKLTDLLPLKDKEKIMKDYNNFLKNSSSLKGCSLNEYLKTAAICYKAVLNKKSSKLTPLQMYKKFADTRDGGMLSIKDWTSAKEFSNWYNSGKWSGSHPFEIIFSWFEHGIHLYPPSSHNSGKYGLRVTDYNYAGVFIEMVKALIKRKIPCIAYNLEEVLDYLAGESYFTVNTYSDNYFNYIPCADYKKAYFKHIEWDEPKILEAVQNPRKKIR